MKQTLRTALSLLALLVSGNLLAAPLGPAITYQGRLDRAGAPASGNYDFVFAAYDSSLFGARVAGPVTNVNVTVSNGLFTTSIDFGAGVFTGSERWLEIYVRTNGGGALTLLDPRQLLTAAPYAHYAPNAGSANSATTAATATTATTANAVAANAVGGSGLQNNAVTAAKIASGQVVKTLNGLTDAVALTPGSNVIVTPVGNNLQIAADPGNDWHLGGNASTTNDFLGTTANVPLELRVNNARALRLEPVGSFVNVIGGHSNNLSVGGSGVTIGGGGSAASPNLAGDRHSTVGGGAGNQAGGNPAFGVGDYATVGGGNRNASLVLWSTVAGGRNNTNVAASGFIGGGSFNYVEGSSSVIGGGYANFAGGLYDAIGGGQSNRVSGDNAVVGGGNGNAATNESATVGGGAGNVAGGFGATVGGGSGNVATNRGSTVAGGDSNLAAGTGASVLGGYQNGAAGPNSSVAGGLINSVTGDSAIVGAGTRNVARGSVSFIGAGERNTTLGSHSAVAGGTFNNATNQYSFVGGGAFNTAAGRSSVVPGGQGNQAAGENSFAAGKSAAAAHDGTFVWSDNSGGSLASTAPNQFLIQAGGGVGIGMNAPSTALEVAGTVKATAFCGDGSLLTGLSAAGLQGTLSLTSSVSPGAVIRAENVNGGTGYAVEGIAAGAGTGVYGNGIVGVSGQGTMAGVSGASAGVGVDGVSGIGIGVKGASVSGTGIEGNGATVGVHAHNTAGTPGRDVYLATAALAGEFHGNVTVLGTVDATALSGNGNLVTGVNASLLGGYSTASYARLDNAANQTFSGPLTVNTNVVVGSLRVNELIRSGSETGGGQTPSPAGLVIRRLNSTSQTTNGVIARTDKLTLERDGTAGGMLIRYPANPGQQTIVCTALNASSSPFNLYNAVPGVGAAGTVRLFTDAQNIAYARIVFGDTFNTGHVTEVTVSRYSTDNYWIGTLTSTFNQ